MYRTVAGIVAALASLLVLVGMTFSASTESEADFTFINGTEPKTLDPHLATGEPEGRLLRSIFEGLMRIDAKTLKPVGGVAKSYEVSDGDKRYTFHLREDARWSDGRPVTAHDFVYSWKRILDPKLASQYAYILHGVWGARAYNTFGGHVAALRGPVRTALLELIQTSRKGLLASHWQKFLAEKHIHSAVEHTKDQLLAERLAQSRGRLSQRELADTSQRLLRHADELEREYKSVVEVFGKSRGVYAKDARTVVVELEAPLPYFLEITTFYPTLPVPRWVVEQQGNENDWFLPGKLVGNGPFNLESWKVNDRIRLEKSQTYWAKAETRSNTIDAYPVENSTTALNLYLTGQVDWLPKTYPEDLASRLMQRDDFYAVPGLVVYFYRLNCQRPPFNDKRVRKAINLAIDRKVITRDVLGRGELPAYHFVPPGIPGYEQPETAISFDVPQAKKLMAEAGYPEGKGFPEVGILYNTFEQHKKIAEVIADQLAQNLNIRVDAYNQEWQSYLATVRSIDYDIARAGWIGDYRDPNTFLDMWVTNGGSNETGFASPSYDLLVRAAGNVPSYIERQQDLLAVVRERDKISKLIEAAARPGAGQPEAQQDLRMALMAELEAMLVQEEFPIVPIYFYVNSGLVAPGVRGFYTKLKFEDGTTAPNLQDIHPLYAVYKE